MKSALLGVIALGTVLSAQEIQLNRIASGLSAPTDIQAAGDGSGRLFFVQQNGIIRVFRNGALVPAPFLDIRSRSYQPPTATQGYAERGLLGLAFPPDYASKGYFYINYTDQQGDTVVARYRISSNPDAADPNSETIIMRVDQPFANHNGGQLRFGPRDGYLYIGLGDGGSAGDPQRNSQNRRARLGKMLRVDVESDLNQVRIPPDNPFANDTSTLPEIWALGLRNPWRYSFDRATGDLWIADVGQNRAEEVNFQPASSRGGENYGWNLMEGLECFTPGCNPSQFTLPVLEYSRGEGCSISGGHVYRGSRWTNLLGVYLYSDYCSGRIWGVRRESDRWVNTLLLNSGKSVSTFGEAEDGEIYLADIASGEVFHVVGTRRPTFTAASVVNAASALPGLVPGSAATIYAAGLLDQEETVSADRIPLPESLAGLRVELNGHAVPLYAVARIGTQEQVNFQVPFETPAGGTATLTIVRDSMSSSPVSVPVSSVQPGIFTTDGTKAIVVHADNTLVTADRPLANGEIVYFYATGLGPVSNSPGTGQAGPRDPLAQTLTRPSVTVGGRAAEVFFSGIAPDFVGVYQINFRVPSGLGPANHPIVITAEGVASRQAVVPVR
jgi:uncharacterized protein (TIGR03437 family)